MFQSGLKVSATHHALSDKFALPTYPHPRTPLRLTNMTLLCIRTPRRAFFESRKTSRGKTGESHHARRKQMVPADLHAAISNSQDLEGGGL